MHLDVDTRPWDIHIMCWDINTLEQYLIFSCMIMMQRHWDIDNGHWDVDKGPWDIYKRPWDIDTGHLDIDMRLSLGYREDVFEYTQVALRYRQEALDMDRRLLDIYKRMIG
jgi:hypothetical protein